MVDEAPSPPLRDALAIGSIAAVAYLLCAPRILYGPDAFTFYQMAQQGGAVHWMHVLYIPILRLGRVLSSPLGIEPFRAYSGASAISTAIGIALLHRAAARLGATRSQAFGLCMLVATMPAVVFFALLLEVQGVFFGAIGLAWLAGAAFVRTPSTIRVVGIGLATGFAAMIHASGHLLPVAVASVALTQVDLRAVPWRRLCAWAVVGACAHAALPVALQVFTDLNPLTSTSNSAHFVSGSTRGAGGLSHLGTIVLDEWFYSFAPCCIAMYCAWRVRGLRTLLAVVHAPFAAYLFVAWALLGYTFGVHGIEHGAYFLPLAFPLAWLTVRSVPLPAVIGLAILGATIAVFHVRAEERARIAPFETRAVIDALGSDHGLLIVQDAHEGEMLALDAPGLGLVPFDVLISGAPRTFDEIVAQFAVQIDALHAQQRPVAFAASVYDRLLEIGDALPKWLETRYRVVPRTVRAFRCYLVLSKQ